MPKRRAIILFGSILVMMVIYTSWCCRDFVLRPRLAFGEVPDDLRRGVSSVYYEADPFPPSELTVDRFLKAISDPFSDTRCKAFVIPFQDFYVGIETSRSEWCYLTKVNGQWTLGLQPPSADRIREGEQAGAYNP